MPLQDSVQALLEQLASAGGPPLEEMSVPDARAMYIGLSPETPEDQVGSIDNRSVSGPGGNVPVRIYTPEGGGDGAGVVFFHGGGWVIGDLETHDHFCRALAVRCDAVVVAVDYRLAPEARFPAAADDCYAAASWVAENAASLGIDASRLAVAGDSAGGNLSAVVAQTARDRGGPALCFQLLLCPVVEYGFDTASYGENADGYLLTRGAMEWFWNHYLGDSDSGGDVRASPAAGDLAGLPPAHVVTAEFDPLRDEGESYAAALGAAGVSTTSKRYDGQIHNFYAMAHLIPEGGPALDEIATALSGRLAQQGNRCRVCFERQVSRTSLQRMSHLLRAIPMALLALGGGAASAQQVDEKAAVVAVLDDFHAAASEADGERYFGHFAESAVFLGTDSTERWTLQEFRAYGQARFDEGTGWTYTPDPGRSIC